MKSSFLKSLRFNMKDDVDKKLYEWLSKLPRGQFSYHTKQFWKDSMEVDKGSEGK